MGADDAAAQDAVALRIEQQLGEAFVAPVGNGTAGGGPGERSAGGARAAAASESDPLPRGVCAEQSLQGADHTGPPRARRQAEAAATVGRPHTGRATIGNALGEAPQACVSDRCRDLPEVRRNGPDHREHRRPAGHRADPESSGQKRSSWTVAGQPGTAWHRQAGRASRLASLKRRKPVSGRVPSGRGPAALVPDGPMLAKRGYRGCSIGADRAGSDGIRRAGDFGKGPGPVWHGSGYRWKSRNRALILPIL